MSGGYNQTQNRQMGMGLGSLGSFSGFGGGSGRSFNANNFDGYGGLNPVANSAASGRFSPMMGLPPMNQGNPFGSYGVNPFNQQQQIVTAQRAMGQPPEPVQQQSGSYGVNPFSQQQQIMIAQRAMGQQPNTSYSNFAPVSLLSPNDPMYGMPSTPPPIFSFGTRNQADFIKQRQDLLNWERQTGMTVNDWMSKRNAAIAQRNRMAANPSVAPEPVAAQGAAIVQPYIPNYI
jgi:hypothetical protein